MIETSDARDESPAPSVVASPRETRALRAPASRERRLLSRLVCASSSRAGPAIRKGTPPAAERNEFLTPAAESPFRRPTRSADASRPPLEAPVCTGTTGGRAVSARCWILRLHNVYRYKLLIRGGASFREGRGRPPRALLAERPQPLIWTFPQEKAPSRSPRKPGGLAAPASARRSPLSPIGPRERARSGPGKEGGWAGSRTVVRAASLTSRRAAAPLGPGRADEFPTSRFSSVTLTGRGKGGGFRDTKPPPGGVGFCMGRATSRSSFVTSFTCL